jgi:hypothetical protein
VVHVGTWHLIGLVKGNPLCHVIATPNMDAMTALCGAGPISGHISGWYDPAEPSACPRCSARLKGPGQVRGRSLGLSR